MKRFQVPSNIIPKVVKKRSVSETEINALVTQDDFEFWCKNYVVKRPGDEPDTLSAFGVPFEES